MRSDKYLWGVCMEIYRQMYKEAKPRADFDKLMKEGITAKLDWFMKYYLSQRRQEEIIGEICRKYKINKNEKKRIMFEVYLGCSPRGVKK